MSTSVQRIPCAPPPDWSEPRHTRQSPPSTLRSAVALDVSFPPPSRPTLKISICFPSLFALSPSMNSKNVHGGWWQSKDRAGTQVGDDDYTLEKCCHQSPQPPAPPSCLCVSLHLFLKVFSEKKQKTRTMRTREGGSGGYWMCVCVWMCIRCVHFGRGGLAGVCSL